MGRIRSFISKRNVFVYMLFNAIFVFGFFVYFTVQKNNVHCKPSLNLDTRPNLLETVPNILDKRPRTLDNRPRIVLGILTSNDHFNFRDAQRSTWISTLNLLQDELPFKITYKFLIDEPSPEMMIENQKYNDIVFLNVTSHGRAVKFGEKLYVWFNYIHETYPDVLLGVKLDDDVFLCVPQIFKRLHQLKSSKLYYGYGFTTNLIGKVRKDVDEMFLVLGKDLLDRIAKRKFCPLGQKCNASINLIDHAYGTVAVATWLSIYNDIDFRPDNDWIVHIGRYRQNFKEKVLRLIKPNFCSQYVLNHKSSLGVMNKLHEYNKPDTLSQTRFAGAVTGSLFSGDVVRKILPMPLTNQHKYLAILDKMPACDNWAVVTTIFSPSKAVKNIASLSNWCLVIVADTKTPSEGAYLHEIGMVNKATERIKYLSVKEQSTLYPLLSELIPVNHFGRKNIGYIYAIHHKAKYIWDFDDDNDGTIDINDFKTDVPFPYVTVCKTEHNKLLNPYPYFGVAETYTWPRGFPLQDIKNKTTLPNLCNSSDPFQLGIVQSLANQQPDIDAIYRLTRNAPFNFHATRKSHRPFVLPKNAYAPFNAQATLWLSPAFAYLALPISVNGRVSDIWRSYIAQHFLHQKDFRLAFASPYVIQDRNVHNIIRDFNAELDLYQKSKQLVEYLSSGKSDNRLDMVELYKSLYMRQYLEQYDIQFIEAWTKTLTSITKSL